MKTKKTNVSGHFEYSKEMMSGKIHPAMKEHTGYCLYKFAQKLRAQYELRLEDLQMIAPQGGILTMLDSVGDMTQVELGQYLSIDKATAVRLIDGLEQQGMIERINDTKDRRAKILRIKPLGKKILAKVQKIRADLENEIFSTLSLEERQQFKKLLQKLIIFEK